jgi:hypothetical protein
MSPGQKLVFASFSEARTFLTVYAPPITYFGRRGHKNPFWRIRLNEVDPISVHIGDLVYVEDSGFFAGGIVESLTGIGYGSLNRDLRVRVKGVWVSTSEPEVHGKHFYLDVPCGGVIREPRSPIPGRWVLGISPTMSDPYYGGT